MCLKAMSVAACDVVFIMSILMPNLVTGGVCISTLFLAAWDSWEVISRNARFAQMFMWLLSHCNKRAAAVIILHFNSIKVFMFFYFLL